MNVKTASAPSVRRRMPPDERRAQLLAIAIDVFAERGLGAARHAEIAERAGVAVSTVFVYFPTREKLVEDVLAELADFFLDLLERAHAQEKPCVEVLRQTGEEFMTLLGTHRSHVLKISCNEAGALHWEVVPKESGRLIKARCSGRD